MPRHPWAVEVTRPSLQSLRIGPPISFGCVFSASFGFPLHTLDDPFAIYPCIHHQDVFHANVYCGLFLKLFLLELKLSFYHATAYVHFDMPWKSNTPVSCCENYMVTFYHSVGK